MIVRKGSSRGKTWHASFGVLLALVILLPLLLPMSAAAEVQDVGPWRGEYYDNANLAGAPKVVRTDQVISFDWGLAAPDAALPNEHFSVRWTAFIPYAAGTYNFRTYTDDGVRLWIDEKLVLDQWHVQAASPYDAQISLAEGHHYIRMEYYDHSDRAIAKLTWELVGASQPTAGGWTGEYYNNVYLSGTSVFSRAETEVNFDWGSGSPGGGIPTDNFSARWTRVQSFAAGNYTFSLATDDGARVWLDSQIIFDRWFDQSASTQSKTVYVAQGQHSLRVEYYERTGTAKAKFWWQGSAPAPTTPVPPPPPAGATEVVVDNLSAGFKKGGVAANWHAANLGYGGHTFWTYNSVYQVFNYATWTPNLPGAGYYDVSIYVPRNYADTRSARYRVFHNGQRHDVWIAQSLYFDKWVKLGQFYFSGQGGEYVYLSDNTHETYASRRLAFDAIKFVRAGAPSPAAPTPAPTPSTYGCAITPQAGFGAIWTNNSTVRSRLGCALEPEKSIQAAEQNLQYGIMFWRSDNKLIYALYNNGVWQAVQDVWKEGDPASDPGMVPPWGYYQPIRGFGKVWRDESGVRARLGWATDQERGFSAAVEPFERGTMIWSDKLGTFVLYQDGTWQRFN